MLYSKVDTHYYDIKQGYVEYEILSGAQLTNETNLNIHGTSKLLFKDWGDTRQEEDHGVVVTKGAINYMQEVRGITQYSNAKIFTVDFSNEQILEHSNTVVSSSKEQETKGFLHRGQDVVAGVLCAMWIAPSVKKCIYKGVVLKLESHVLGISYVKKATKIDFDANISKEQFVLPSFPKNSFGLIKDNIKTKKVSASENVCKVFKDVTNSVDSKNKSFEPNKNIDIKRRNKFVNRIAKGIFEKQKEVLPKILLSMKKNRECLQLNNNISEKTQCISIYNEDIKALGTDDYMIFKDKKEKPIDVIEDAIIGLESHMPCVKRAKNFIDISSCMK